ncbi:hypothetical protein [Streptomyces sp. HB132]|uniref:hypothetical protein n=1 Tax=Streptomyces sp. HB132 TaxID=767388 RepID=UPI001960CF11|nr:hypothetical protein [Streptomyces sp. HB132]MBM7442791.1 hypothetical protein [Streptomyces sp. HB132]
MLELLLRMEFPCRVLTDLIDNGRHNSSAALLPGFLVLNQVVGPLSVVVTPGFA